VLDEVAFLVGDDLSWQGGRALRGTDLRRWRLVSERAAGRRLCQNRL